jgi:type II secretory pathway predicted ATPase ExeA
VWIEPTAPRFTSEAVLTQEEHVVSWAMLAQVDDPAPSPTVDIAGLDPLQAAAAGTVAGGERLAMIVGPAGAGKTRTLAAAVADLDRHGRAVIGVSPTAKAARVLQRDTGMYTDTVAKVLFDWHQPDGLGGPLAMPAGGTLIVDEAGMLSTPNLHDLIRLVEDRQWRLVLVGDPRQLQAVGRGGLFGELCANGRVDVLEQLHRFSERWEAAASLQLRVGDGRALDAYEHHGRIRPGAFDEHVAVMARAWLDGEAAGERVALVAASNDHVAVINRAVQQARLAAGYLDTATGGVVVAGGGRVWPGDVVMTRRNDRHLTTTAREPVRNRELWTVERVDADGSLAVSRRDGGDTVTLPVEYVRERVQLGYAATAHGYQADTVDRAYALVSAATSRRGLYVAATRGREANVLCVVTDSDDVTEARDVLEAVLSVDRADVPAVAARRQLAEQAAHAPAAPAAPVERCAIPDWFPRLLDESRHTLADAKERRAELQTRHDEIEAAVVAATGQLEVVARDTAGDRDALATAKRRADEARWAVGAAERRLEAAGWRQRRPLRHALDDAHQRQDRAVEYLARVEARTAPAVERYGQAVTNHRQAEDDRRTHRALTQLNSLGVDVSTAAYLVRALAVWERWATGAPVTDGELQNARQVLGQMPPTAETRYLIGELTADPAFTTARPQRARGGDHELDHGIDVGIDRSPGFDLGR